MFFINVGHIITSAELILILLFALIPFALLIISLVDVMKRNIPQIEKVFWIVLVVFALLIGPILYLTIGKKRNPNTMDQLGSWT